MCRTRFLVICTSMTNMGAYSPNIHSCIMYTPELDLESSDPWKLDKRKI